jgi:NTE family protein
MPPSPATDEHPRTAFVLAGGGFKGAFELGALDHLINERGILPDVITSASAGSILGMVLAQARTPDEFAARLVEARNDLLAMSATDVVFGEQPWLAQLDDTTAADAIKQLITERTRPELPGGNPDPDPQGDSDAGPRWRMIRDRWTELAAVAHQLPAARRAHKEGEGGRNGVLNLDPFEAAIRDGTTAGIAKVHPDLVARDGLDLRMAVTAVKARQTHYICGDGTLVGPDARTQVRATEGFDLIDGAIASSSVPGVFPPRRLGADTYVDGGCLQNIPLAAAASLGPDRIFTVIAVPVREPERKVSLWAAQELGFLATQMENLAAPLPEGCTNTVIEPTLEVVGSFEVHPGLMLIDIGYGHMRAEEALADLDDGTSRIVTTASDTVTLERDRAWHLEDACLRDRKMSDDRRRALLDLKAAVRGAVQARTAMGFSEPPRAEQWWTGWELHTRDIPHDFPQDFG